MVEKKVSITITADVDDSEVQALEDLIESIESEFVKLGVEVEDEEVEATKDEIEELDGTEIDLNVDNIAAMEAIDQISSGFDRLKQGAMEAGQELGVVLEAAGKQEMNKTFLEMNLGADKAKASLQDISDIVNDMPGDDTALQGLLSQAMVKNAGMTKEELRGMAGAATDYFSAMSFYGKSASEAQQDMTNYILSGNTAELERSPILQEHIDKLKEGTTVQERSQLLQEALNEAGWGGISTQDTYNNKLETFNGMLERGKYNLGGMFQEGAKSAMDFIMKLDESTNGIVGMGIALGGFASPLTDSIFGLGQMATGIKAIKDLGMIQYLKELEIVTKLSAAADWLLSGAQAVLNAVMAMNPIVLVVIALVALAAALIWAYYNVDWFRERIDNLWKEIVEFGQIIRSFSTGAISAFLNWTDTASAAVSNFIRTIATLPSKLSNELNKMLSAVNRWAATLPQKFWNAGVGAVKNFLSALGIASPGTMQRMLVWEISEMGRKTPLEGRKLLTNIGRLGSDIVDEFGDPTLGIGLETMNNSLASGNGNGYGQVINLSVEVGNVDNEDRVQEIVDAIRRELAWNNATAGRTV